ncbi:MAG TPA: hypothetical protein VEQ58_04085, partial [Polyangiaceae bacterium]|nr:hypothetical protein [Polyangiaceae bacterium]
VVTALVRSEMSEEAEKKDVSADRVYRDLVAEQRAKLDAPVSYIDRAKGTVALPIERAMEVTVEGLKKDPNSATPPAPAGSGGSGGGAPDAAAVGGGAGSGGSGGAATAGTTNPAPGEAAPGTVGAEQQPTEADKDGKPAEKKKAPAKAVPGIIKPPTTPAAPAPAPAAPAPAPAPNGQ